MRSSFLLQILHLAVHFFLTLIEIISVCLADWGSASDTLSDESPPFWVPVLLRWVPKLPQIDVNSSWRPAGRPYPLALQKRCNGKKKLCVLPLYMAFSRHFLTRLLFNALKTSDTLSDTLVIRSVFCVTILHLVVNFFASLKHLVISALRNW